MVEFTRRSSSRAQVRLKTELFWIQYAPGVIVQPYATAPPLKPKARSNSPASRHSFRLDAFSTRMTLGEPALWILKNQPDRIAICPHPRESSLPTLRSTISSGG